MIFWQNFVSLKKKKLTKQTSGEINRLASPWLTDPVFVLGFLSKTDCTHLSVEDFSGCAVYHTNGCIREHFLTCFMRTLI